MNMILLSVIWYIVEGRKKWVLKCYYLVIYYLYLFFMKYIKVYLVWVVVC